MEIMLMNWFCLIIKKENKEEDFYRKIGISAVMMRRKNLMIK